MSTPRVLGNILAQEYMPPPAAITGEEMMAVAKRKTSQGQRKKTFALKKSSCSKSGCQDPGCQPTPGLHMLQTIQPASLNTIRSDGWEDVLMAVDSGASETVIGEDMVMSAALKESEGSQRGFEI